MTNESVAYHQWLKPDRYPAFACMVGAPEGLEAEQRLSSPLITLQLCTQKACVVGPPSKPIALLPSSFQKYCIDTLAGYLSDHSLPSDLLARVAALTERLNTLNEQVNPAAVDFMYHFHQLMWDVAVVKGANSLSVATDGPPTKAFWSAWFGHKKPSSIMGPSADLRLTIDGAEAQAHRLEIYQRLQQYREQYPIHNLQADDQDLVEAVVHWGISSQGMIAMSPKCFLRLQAAYPDLNLTWLTLGVGKASLLEAQHPYHHEFQPAQQAALEVEAPETVYQQEENLQSHFVERMNTALECLLGWQEVAPYLPETPIAP